MVSLQNAIAFGGMTVSRRKSTTTGPSTTANGQRLTFGRGLFVLLLFMCVIPLLNLYGSIKSTDDRRILMASARISPSLTSDNRVSLFNKNEQNTASASADASMFKRIKNENNQKKKKSSVVVFVCTARYCPAVASSIHSLRVDGGYKNDVAVILDESFNYTSVNLKRDLKSYNLTVKKKRRRKGNIRIFTVKRLFDSLLRNQTTDLEKLREPPPMPSCMLSHRKRGHRGYYMKTLIFHPEITAGYTKVLFMDSCMTFHSPHIQEILDLPMVESSLLAAPDPWQWQKRGIGGRVLKCADKNAYRIANDLVGGRMRKAGYFNTAFMLFDSAIVNNYAGQYGSPTSTLLELLSVYHTIGPAFQGNQDILSVYWVYMRHLYRVLPHVILGSPRVPYDFVRSMKKGAKYIVTAGNVDREVCTTRPTNKFAKKK